MFEEAVLPSEGGTTATQPKQGRTGKGSKPPLTCEEFQKLLNSKDNGLIRRETSRMTTHERRCLDCVRAMLQEATELARTKKDPEIKRELRLIKRTLNNRLIAIRYGVTEDGIGYELRQRRISRSR